MRFHELLLVGLLSIALLSCEKKEETTEQERATSTFATIALTASDRVASSGSSPALSWTLGGEYEGLELEIIARAPGRPMPNGSEVRAFVQGGLPPATGDTRWLGDGSTWSSTQASRRAQSGDANAPTLDIDGEWTFTALLRDATRGDQVVAVAQTAVLVSARPSMHLKINRLVGSPTDYIDVELETLAGIDPEPVKIFASLTGPDRASTTLPGQSPFATYAHEGESSNAVLPLYSGTLVEGSHLLAVYLLGENDEVLSYAEATLSICERVGTLGVLVQDQNAQVFGSEVISSEIAVWDLLEGAPVQQQPLGESSGANFMVGSGQYIVSAKVITAAGKHFAVSDPFDFVTCTGLPAIKILTTGEPEPLGAEAVSSALVRGAQSALTPMDYASDGLPKPRVKISLISHGAGRLEAENAYDTFVSGLRSSEPDVRFLSEDQLTEVMNQVIAQQSSGSDDDTTITTLDTITAQDYIITLVIDKRVDTRLYGHVVDVATTAVVSSQMLRVGDRNAMVDDDSIDALVTLLTTPSLYTRLRSAQDKPLDPRLSLVLSSQRTSPGSTITATATLKDVNGAPAAGKQIEFVRTSPTLTDRMTAMTDANGVATVSIPVGSVASTMPINGTITAHYTRANGQVRKSPGAWYVVDPQGDLVFDFLWATVQPSSSLPVTVKFQREGSPVAGATIDLTATSGTFSPAQATTDANGEISVGFYADATPGMATLTAQVTAGGDGTTATYVFVGHPISFSMEASPTTVMSPATSSIRGTVLMDGVPVPNLTVSLSATAGTLAPATATDALGAFLEAWQPPSTGAALVNIAGEVSIAGARYTQTTQVSYAATGTPPPILDVRGLYTGTTQFTFLCTGCGGSTCPPQDPVSSMLTITATGATWVENTTAGSITRMFTGMVRNGSEFSGTQTPYYEDVYGINVFLSESGQLTGVISDPAPTCHRFVVNMMKQ